MSRGSFASVAARLMVVGSVLSGPVTALGANKYVDQNCPGATHDGTSWATAALDLAPVLSGAVPGDVIYVARGVYKPTTGSDVTISFVMKNGVALYGGYSTGGATRDPAAYPSVLSGDLANNDTKDGSGVVLVYTDIVGTDNSYHVVRADGTNATAILDGFTLTAGRAFGPLGTTAPRFGGGLLIFDSQGSPTLNELVFRGNTAVGPGGGMAYWGGSPVLTNVTFRGNGANQAGGLYASNISSTPCSSSLTNVVFQENANFSVSGVTTGGPFGGGMAAAYCTNVLTHVQFLANTSEGGGAGFQTMCTPESCVNPTTLTDVLFDGNIDNASNSAGGGMLDYGNATFNDVTFRNNHSAWGGGLRVTGTGSVLNRVTFTNNTAGHGGALSTSGAITVNDSVFIGNTATAAAGSQANGGAIDVGNGIYTGGITLTNSLISGNYAMSYGGGILMGGAGALVLTNVTIAGNHGDGIYRGNGSLDVRNSILWGNSGVGISGATGTVSHTTVQGGCPGGATCTSVQSADPAFVTPVDHTTAPTTAGDLHLLPASPAIDAGNNGVASPSLPATDLDGNPRRVDVPETPDTGVGTAPIVDFGAYEVQGPAPDLTATKTNSVAGSVAVGVPFSWTVAVANTGSLAATFASGSVLLRDDLPSTGATYGTPSAGSFTNVTGSANIACAIDGSSTLVCTASGGSVTVGGTTGRFVVTIPVTGTGAGTLANPRAAGTCATDPGGVVAEVNEGNNGCANSVTVSTATPTLTTAVHDASHAVITSAPVGTLIHGSAAVGGSGPGPTGTVTLRIYDNATCTGTPVTSETQSLVLGGAESTPRPAVSFFYQVTYNGDGAYVPVSGGCTLFSATQPGPTLTVNTLLDDAGDGLCTDVHCTLREALTASNGLAGANTIDFSVSGTIAPTSNLPNVTDLSGLTIDGTGHGITVSGSGVRGIFLTLFDVPLALVELALVGGYASAGGAVRANGPLTVTRCTFSHNTADPVGGGAIFAARATTVTSSTFSANSGDFGGALEANGASLTITNSTFSDNTAQLQGGAVYVLGGSAALKNVTFSGNTAMGGAALWTSGTRTVDNTLFVGAPIGGSCYSSVSGSIGSGNLSGDASCGLTPTANLLVGALGSYGGPTQTSPLLPGSAAIDAGDAAVCAGAGVGNLDQRGIPRPAGACDVGAFESRGFTLSVVYGSDQSTVIGTAFPSALSAAVAAVDPGEPVASGLVTFTAPGSGPSGTFPGGVTAVTVPTDAGGHAVTPYPLTANLTAGSYPVNATTAGGAGPLPFALTNLVSAPASIAIAGGNSQSATILTAFAAPLSVLVRDAGNNPVPGATVTFTAPGSGASGTFVATGTATETATTDGTGVATSSSFTANGTAGTYGVSAAVGGLSPVSFSLTNVVGAPATIGVVSGTPQSATILTTYAAPLVAVVRDGGGNPVPNVTVTFTAPGSGASATFPSGPTATTNASGQASVPVSADATVGAYAVTANVTPPVTPASFSLTNTVGAPATITVVSGTPQSAAILAAFGAPLVAVVRDAGSNPVPNVTVTFTAPGSGASATFPSGATATTNASGQASVPVSANGTEGPYAVTANVAPPLTPASFSLTNTVGAPATITVVSGSGQSATVLTDFGAPLVARVLDAGGNPVPSAAVTFSAPGSGAGATFPSTATATTGANGEASVTVRANGTAGSYAVTANVATPLSPAASFSLTNLCPVITSKMSSGSTICAGDSVTVTVDVTGGTGPYTVTLSNGGGTAIGMGPDFAFPVAPLATTTYSVASITDSLGCGGSGDGDTTVTVGETPKRPDPFLEATGTVCPGQRDVAYSVPPEPDVTYVWTYTGTGVSIQDYGARALLSFGPSATSGTLSVVGVSSCGQGPAREIEVTVVAPAATGAPQTICALGTTAPLGGSSPVGASGTWSLVSGGTGTFQPDPGTPDATFTHTGGAGPVVLRWTVSGACGTTSADTIVTVTLTPTATLSGSATTCAGRSTPLTVTLTSGTAPFSVVVNGETYDFPTSPGTIEVSPLETTTYRISSVTSGTCENPSGGSGSATVTVAEQLCIDDVPGDARFRVEVRWATTQGAFDGTEHPGHPIPTTSIGLWRGGLFWFFDKDNPELLVKVLDGCDVNGFHWVLIGAGTNVGYTITVTDTASGLVRTYTNPDGTAPDPVLDIEAFPCAGAATNAAEATARAPEAFAADAACTSDGTTLCIDDAPGDRRFRIAMDWATVQGTGQSGKAHPLSTASLGVTRGGLFWFFHPDNPETLVKVLNGCGVNGKYWFFSVSVTNVGYTVTVTDTVTGVVRTFAHADLTPAGPAQDVNAFPCD